MENLSYVGLSHQMALRQQMETISNNVANMSTPGFKSQSMIFEEFLNQDPGSKDYPLSQVIDRASWRNTAQGTLTMTGNPLDMAISGPGYFGIETPQGIQYTRAGNFALNADREIVTAQGYIVVDEGGGAISVPEGDTHITVDSKGNISTESGDLGRLKLVRFENEQELKQVGGGLYDAGDAAEIEIEDEAVIQQGAIEGSNVQPVLEMTKMIDVLRTYQSVQRMVQNDHDRIRSAIRTLSQVN